MSGELTVEVVIPVNNEEQILEASVRTLRTYLDRHFPFTARITVADNASTDGTWAVASRLAATLDGVDAVHLAEKGRGRALRRVWEGSEAAVVAYMDVDLSTGLDAMLPLVAPLLSGHSDVAIGSRLAIGARVVRGPKREAISRLYNFLIRTGTGHRFTDAQCGFKALRADAARPLLPLVHDNGWFFDTELLMVAEYNGLRIHEVPVDWVDDPDSRVDILATAVDDLRGLWRVSRRRAAGRGLAQVRSRRPARGEDTTANRFLGEGGLSTLAYLGLFVGLAPSLGLLAANALALTVCTLANVFAHYRYTFGERDGSSDQSFAYERFPPPHRGAADSVDRVADVGYDGGSGQPDFGRPDLILALTAGLSLLVGLALTSLGLAVAEQVSSSLVVAVVVVTATNAVVSAGRFLAWRGLLFRRHLDRLAVTTAPHGVSRA